MCMLIKIILQRLKNLFFADGKGCHYDVLNKQGKITSTGRNNLNINVESIWNSIWAKMQEGCCL